jgi:hypothetical protein
MEARSILIRKILQPREEIQFFIDKKEHTGGSFT